MILHVLPLEDKESNWLPDQVIDRFMCQSVSSSQ